MSLQDTLMTDLKAAMKAKDLITRDTLRMIRSKLGEAEMSKGGALSDDEMQAVLRRGIKTRTESAKQYDDGGRAELAEKERAEIEVIQRYLPKQLDEAEARAAIEAIAKELGVSEKKQMGQLMKAIRERHGGLIDGRVASQIAGSLLS